MISLKITHWTYTGVLTLCAPMRFFWEVDLRPKIEMLRIDLDRWSNANALNMIFYSVDRSLKKGDPITST